MQETETTMNQTKYPDENNLSQRSNHQRTVMHADAILKHYGGTTG